MDYDEVDAPETALIPDEMDLVMPWGELLALIAPHAPVAWHYGGRNAYSGLVRTVIGTAANVNDVVGIEKPWKPAWNLVFL